MSGIRGDESLDMSLERSSDSEPDSAQTDDGRVEAEARLVQHTLPSAGPQASISLAIFSNGFPRHITAY